MATHHTVPVGWLAERLGQPNLVIADCRFNLGHKGDGQAAYQAGHIPGAIYLDLERDLSAPIGIQGGRHPLPDPEQLAALFSRIGIDETTTVVAYDAQDMAMAARLWWLLRYLGHERVYILDGGFPAWEAAGLPVTQEVPAPTPRTFISRLRPEMLVTAEQVLARPPQTVLIDSRAPERYRGEVEPLDPKAGHIPGSTNYFFKENLKPDGTLQAPQALQQRFAALPEGEIMVYCGSGVTACVNVLALLESGRTNVKLYAGSWSDWCSRDLPVATGDEE